MNLHVVLVRSEYAANVGSAARAMANMGASRLILIDPRCELNEKAREMAAGAQENLLTSVVYSSWREFLEKEGDGLRLALTRRTGRQRKVFSLKEKLAELGPNRPENIYLIFGPEADGLDAEDLAYVNFCVHLPVFGEFGSMNLAQAVLLALYITREQFPPAEQPSQTKGESPVAIQPFYFPDQLIKDWLTAMGFDVRARKASAYLTLRRLFLQNQPTRHEFQVLEAVLQQNIRKLRETSPPCDGKFDLQPE